ncbi:suppressor of fused domain protein [Kitasatospora sp. NPDC001175]|uniref:suppressor of fused domain protein n=1 Tax=Kitasatospora sp. NPDC001175 TaxID=3157103 RepID=UPI003D05E593
MIGAWSPPASAAQGTPQVACFREGQLPGTQAFATIDLSRTPLWHPTSDRHFHLELLACENISRTNGYGRVPEVLEYVAGQPTASGEAILHGDVVALPAPLPGGTMTSLYAGLPAYFDDDFSSVTIENGIDVVVVWLIPITAEETAFIRDRGWEAFEDALVRQDPDLLDPGRPPARPVEPCSCRSALAVRQRLPSWACASVRPPPGCCQPGFCGNRLGGFLIMRGCARRRGLGSSRSRRARPHPEPPAARPARY